ncbi:MAG: M67 family metallopeptidase [Anaerolineae bacterium]|nr:M67 family metallopeptidase [Anaerolineae bacterium]
MSGVVWLRPALAAQILDHARADAPREACGLLIGQGGTVEAIVPARNAADDATRFFRLDERDLVRAVFDAERRGQVLVGFYHSHPDGVAMPSQTDIAQSYYPDAVHVIAGLRSDPALAAWRLRYGEAERLTLEVTDLQPAALNDGGNRKGVRTAVVIAAVLALALMIALSLALLPPAPRLPVP